jgi:hypothetical protein
LHGKTSGNQAFIQRIFHDATQSLILIQKNFPMPGREPNNCQLNKNNTALLKAGIEVNSIPS